MSAVRRPLGTPFSERPADPADLLEGQRLLPIEQVQPQQPPAVDTEHEARRPGRRPLGLGPRGPLAED